MLHKIYFKNGNWKFPIIYQNIFRGTNMNNDNEKYIADKIGESYKNWNGARKIEAYEQGWQEGIITNKTLRHLKIT